MSTNAQRIASLEHWRTVHKREHKANPLHSHEAPPDPPSITGPYGPAIAADGKDNRVIGWANREVGHRWTSAGGRMTSYAFNQRFDADGKGYSMGDGGLIELSLWRCDGGLPSGSALSTLTFPANSPRTGAERKDPIPWSADVPAGLVCILTRNVHADPAHNWMSANELWVGKADTPRQPAFPHDDMAVLSKGEAGTDWSVWADNTPVFDVTFADGHHEGQAYHGVIVGYEVFVSGTTKVRERFTLTSELKVVAAWFRVQRISGSGPLTLSLGGVSGTADISGIPSVSGTSLTGGVWVRVPLVVTLPAGSSQALEVSVPADTTIKAMPIRETYGQSNPYWGSRQFTEGEGEKSTGGPWSSMYLGVADLQCYLEVG